MEFERLRDYFLAKNGASEDFPFGAKTRVIKVAGKMFVLLRLAQQPLQMNLKCDPLQSELLRERYSAVLPGYHMNMQHWNSLLLDGPLPEWLVLRRSMLLASWLAPVFPAPEVATAQSRSWLSRCSMKVCASGLRVRLLCLAR